MRVRNPIDLSKDQDSKSEAEKVQNLDELIEYMETLTDDKTFERNFTEFTTKTSTLAFYILFELEKNRMSGVVPLPHGPSQHVEHIMPKRPSNKKERLNNWDSVETSQTIKIS